MRHMMKFIPARAALVAGALLMSTAAHAASGQAPEIQRQQWPFAGFKGQFDKNQLQRGFLVYKEVCASCHGLKRLNFRNLSEPGGPEFAEAAVKQLAAEWLNQIPEINDAGEIAGKGGELLKRAARPSDPILGPYANDAAAPRRHRLDGREMPLPPLVELRAEQLPSLPNRFSIDHARAIPRRARHVNRSRPSHYDAATAPTDSVIVASVLSRISRVDQHRLLRGDVCSC